MAYQFYENKQIHTSFSVFVTVSPMPNHNEKSVSHLKIILAARPSPAK